jgi:hypothetical protein
VIDVVVTCYFPQDAPERQEYARRSVKSLILNLGTQTELLRLVIADDSADEHAALVNELLAYSVRYWNSAVHTRSYHNGIGASLNAALDKVSDVWLYTTDDWELQSALNLDGPLHLLRQGYDLVRLGPVHPDLCCTTRFQQGIGWWLDLLPHYGGFAFATRPFLATKDFWKKIGPFDEGLNSYETERLYAERVARSTSKLAYWGGIDLAGPWEHIGLVEVGYRDVA